MSSDVSKQMYHAEYSEKPLCPLYDTAGTTFLEWSDMSIRSMFQ